MNNLYDSITDLKSNDGKSNLMKKTHYVPSVNNFHINFNSEMGAKGDGPATSLSPNGSRKTYLTKHNHQHALT